jgi:putative transposase
VWNLPPPPGFQGLHPHKPVTMYLRHLPHWRQEGATYFVTFRLNDSLPQVKLDELEQVRREWTQRHPPPHTEAQFENLSRESMRRVEKWLDQGMGSCRLQDRAAAQLVVKALHYFDGQRYELGSYVVMPNHVHAIVRPLTVGQIFNPSSPFGRIEIPSYENRSYELERILQSWKRQTARTINRHFRTSGPLWQDESFDRIIRDEEHLWRALQYIGANSSKAGLSREQCPTWLRPQWVKLGWRFE